MDPVVEIVHALPRRVHVRAPLLAGHHDACVRIADRLAREALHERVSVRERTGSVFVERAEGALDPDAVARALTALVLEERDAGGRPLTAPGARATAEPVRIARAVAHAFANIDDDVERALDGRADLATLFSLALATAACVEVIVTEEIPAPTWFNLLWWSLRSFMTFNVEATIEAHRHASANNRPHEIRENEEAEENEAFEDMTDGDD
jgi:hypothetical protein